jgi:hypothetical protein
MKQKIEKIDYDDLRKRILSTDKSAFDEVKKLKRFQKQRLFLKDIQRTGFIGLTCKRLHYPHTVVDRWIKTNPNFAKAVCYYKSLRDEFVGFTLYQKAIQEGDTAALIFICKTRGRYLGFDDRDNTFVNINISDTTPKLDVSKLTNEERRQITSTIKKGFASEGVIDI